MDGLLDLVGSTANGGATARGKGSKGYHWQAVHTRTLANQADGRINSFGIGGEIEVRAGQLFFSDADYIAANAFWPGRTAAGGNCTDCMAERHGPSGVRTHSRPASYSDAAVKRVMPMGVYAGGG